AKVKAKGKKGEKALPKAEKKVADGAAAIAKAQKALDEASAGEKGGDARVEVDKLTIERDSLKAQTQAAPLNAPAAGFVADLKIKPGDTAQVGTSVCRLDDSKTLKVKLQVPKGSDVAEGQAATLTVSGKPLKVKIE